MPASPTEFPIRFSHLHRMAESPAHYVDSLLEDVKQTPAMRLGKLVHAIYLGGQYIVYEGDRRGNKWKDFKEENAGKEIVTATELETANRMVESIRRHPETEFVLTGQHEVELSWKTLGRDCLGHIDVVGGLHISELKTGATSRPGRFVPHGLQRAYHAQLAWYMDGLAATGSRRTEAFIVVVASSKPYVTTVFRVSDRALDEGRKLWRLWLEQVLNCEQSDYWPGYCESILPFDVAEDVELLIDGEELEVA